MKKLLVTAIGAAAALGPFADFPLRFEGMADGPVTTNELNATHGEYWTEAVDATNNTYAIQARTAEIVARQSSIDAAPTKEL